MTEPHGLPSIDRLVIDVRGRPAPKGSYREGEHGQMRAASPYLPAWGGEWIGKGRQRRRRAGAVERAVYGRYHVLGVDPAALPLFRGPVGIEIIFAMPGERADVPPDSDKLERAVWDALTVARVWEDDARVVDNRAMKIPASGNLPPGAHIEVWSVNP